MNTFGFRILFWSSAEIVLDDFPLQKLPISLIMGLCAASLLTLCLKRFSLAPVPTTCGSSCSQNKW